MPNQASLEQCRRLLNRLSADATTDLHAMLATLKGSDRVLMSQMLAEGWVALVEHFGDQAADIGADQFDQWATELGASPRVVLADGVNEQRATARLGWALSTPNQLGNMATLLDELVKQPFRSTVQDSAHKSGLAWARVPTGSETCSFCLMLASRGAVYRSEQVAQFGFSGKKYHGMCDCTPAPVRGPEDYPKGYDPDGLYDQYQQARKEAESGDPSKILAAMRDRFDGK